MPSPDEARLQKMEPKASPTRWSCGGAGRSTSTGQESPPSRCREPVGLQGRHRKSDPGPLHDLHLESSASFGVAGDCDLPNRDKGGISVFLFF